jgi:hypothetical protein
VLILDEIALTLPVFHAETQSSQRIIVLVGQLLLDCPTLYKSTSNNQSNINFDTDPDSDTDPDPDFEYDYEHRLAAASLSTSTNLSNLCNPNPAAAGYATQECAAFMHPMQPTHYSTTPLLHYSTTPLLHYSI